MKLILSRKGFDSGAGKVPSPIFPDGTMLSLPIPDKGSTIANDDITGPGRWRVGSLVEILTGGRVKRHYKAHLDPDLNREAFPRESDWTAVLGQVGAALGHLEKHGIGADDLFLFFGLFQEVEGEGVTLHYKKGALRQHVLFGWLQVGRKLSAEQAREELPWIRYHPHAHREPGPKNMVYIARERLTLPGIATSEDYPGAGVFGSYSESLRLTAPDASSPSQWRLPRWFHPERRPSSLTYHGKSSRWSKTNGALLQAASRGQEFVLDCNDYPEAHEWIAALLKAQFGSCSISAAAEAQC